MELSENRALVNSNGSSFLNFLKNMVILEYMQYTLWGKSTWGVVPQVIWPIWPMYPIHSLNGGRIRQYRSTTQNTCECFSNDPLVSPQINQVTKMVCEPLVGHTLPADLFLAPVPHAAEKSGRFALLDTWTDWDDLENIPLPAKHGTYLIRYCHRIGEFPRW